MLKPGTIAFTVSLGLFAALGPISTDMYLPSLPDMSRVFEADAAKTQLTLSGFLIGFALGQLIYGPLSDAYGRRPVLMSGLVLYMIATIMCVAANSMNMLIIARIIQALGVAAVAVIVRAIVRDVFSGAQAARTLSYIGSIMGLVPMVAPLLGSLLHGYFGWRSNFVVLLLFAATAAVLVLLFLPETISQASYRTPSLRIIFSKYRAVLSNRVFLIFVVIASLSFSGLFAFISASSFILQNQFGLTIFEFGFSFGIGVFGYIVGTLMGARLVGHIGIDRTIGIGSLLLAAGGLAMYVFTFLNSAQAWQIIVPFFIYLIGVGLTLPQCMAGALQPFASMAGTASSALGCIQLTSGAVAGVIVGQNLGDTPLPLALTMAISGCVALAVIALARHFRLTVIDPAPAD